jgi:hypothetical protein
MFAIISNGVIALLVPAGTVFTWAETQYPSNWLNLSSPEEKAAIGMVDVIHEARADDRYFWVTEGSPTLADGVVRIGYTSTPKELVGLRKQATDAIDEKIYLTLKTSDYIMVRNYQDPTYKPNWITWRDSVLSTGRTAKDEIAAATSVESLIAVVWTIPNDPDYVAPTEAV